MIIISILTTVLIFGLLIFVHELGHFLTAKFSGIKINEFAIGMGPKIISRKGKETRYSLRLFPIGGYVSMEGEDKLSNDDRSFSKAPVLKRILIVVAGSLMNFVLGFVILIIIVSFAYKILPTTTIKEISKEAVQSGLTAIQPGDKILKINGENIYVYNDVAMMLSQATSDKFDISIKRNNQRINLQDITLKKVETSYNGQKYLSYGLTFKTEEKTILSTLKYSTLQAIDLVKIVKMGIEYLFSGKTRLKDLSGPIGISVALNETAKTSVSTMWWMVAFISVNLGVMNLLPLPALDGGRLVFLLFEFIFRRRINQKYEEYINAAGFVLLMAFSAVIFFSDIMKLVK